MSKKKKQLRLFDQLEREQCAASVEAYFQKIGPLGSDLLPLKTKQEKERRHHE